MNPFRWRWLWALAERKDWTEAFPRPFWRFLLRKCDRAHGHIMEYDE
jgi:hypothetical protein